MIPFRNSKGFIQFEVVLALSILIIFIITSLNPLRMLLNRIDTRYLPYFEYAHLAKITAKTHSTDIAITIENEKLRLSNDDTNMVFYESNNLAPNTTISNKNGIAIKYYGTTKRAGSITIPRETFTYRVSIPVGDQAIGLLLQN